MSSSLTNGSKSGKNNFGLVEKTCYSPKDNVKIINAKLAVSAEFYERWNRAMGRLNTRFSGGTSAILLNAIEELLPQLEAMAKDIPETDAKGGAL